MSKICKDNRKTCCDLYLGTDHVLLDKVIFKVLGSLERDTLTEVLKEIDTKLSEYDTKILFRTRLINIGSSEPIYKGYNLKNGHEFKTLKGTDKMIIKSTDTDVVIDVDFSTVPNKQDFNFTNIGSGVDILESSYKQGDVFNANFRKVRSNDLEVTTDSSKSLVVNYKSPDKESITELKNINFTSYVEIVRNAIKIANAKL